MKKAILLMMLAAVLLCAGCHEVSMSPVYSKLLDDTAALSEETAKRAEADALSPSEMKLGLRSNADAWQKFRDARDGVKPPEVKTP